MTLPLDKHGNVAIEYFAELQRRAVDPEARHRNEVALIAGLETHAQRSVYIEGEGGVRDRRGNEVADRLRKDVWALLKLQGRAVEPQQEALFA